jgi:hypothetical protein
MKELTSIRANHGYIDAVNGRDFIEIIIITTEPGYQYTDGEVNRKRETETHRFFIDTKGIESMIEFLQNIKEKNQHVIKGLEEWTKWKEEENESSRKPNRE